MPICHLSDCLYWIFLIDVDYCGAADLLGDGQAWFDLVGQDDIDPLGYQRLRRHDPDRPAAYDNRDVSRVVRHVFNRVDCDTQVLQQGNLSHTYVVGYLAQHSFWQDRVLSIRTTPFAIDFSIIAYIGVPSPTLVAAPAVYENIDRDPVSGFETLHVAAHFGHDGSHLVTQYCWQLEGWVRGGPSTPIINLHLAYANATVFDLEQHVVRVLDSGFLDVQ